MQHDEYYVAKYYQVPVETVKRMARSGDIPSINMGYGRRMFEMDDVRAIVEASESSGCGNPIVLGASKDIEKNKKRRVAFARKMKSKAYKL